MTERIVFEPEPHRYWHVTPTGRRELPSVTAVLKAAGYARPEAYLKPADAARGTDVHDATLVVDRYPSDWERRVDDDAIGNYAESYAKLLGEHTVAWELSEQVVADTAVGVAGRLDRLGLIDGIDALVDFKSGGDDPVYGPQLAGYERMAPKPDGMRVRRKRFVVLLQKDGSRALFVPKTERADYDAFLAAVHTFYWRKQNGRL